METDKLHYIDNYIILVWQAVSDVLLNSHMREIELTLLNDAANTSYQWDDGRLVSLAGSVYLAPNVQCEGLY